MKAAGVLVLCTVLLVFNTAFQLLMPLAVLFVWVASSALNLTAWFGGGLGTLAMVLLFCPPCAWPFGRFVSGHLYLCFPRLGLLVIVGILGVTSSCQVRF